MNNKNSIYSGLLVHYQEYNLYCINGGSDPSGTIPDHSAGHTRTGVGLKKLTKRQATFRTYPTLIQRNYRPNYQQILHFVHCYPRVVMALSGFRNAQKDLTRRVYKKFRVFEAKIKDLVCYIAPYHLLRICWKSTI
jgi:hypothetical protein